MVGTPQTDSNRFEAWNTLASKSSEQERHGDEDGGTGFYVKAACIIPQEWILQQEPGELWMDKLRLHQISARVTAKGF